MNSSGSTQLEPAYTARREGQEANLAAGTKPHRDDTVCVENAIAELIRQPAPFTADTVHQQIQRLNPQPYDRNLVASVLGRHARKRHIVRVYDKGLTPSHSASRRGSRNAWWIGVQHVKRPADQIAGR